jgi:hypothetical protein
MIGSAFLAAAARQIEARGELSTRHGLDWREVSMVDMIDVRYSSE